jgi:hypothetical protein
VQPLHLSCTAAFWGRFRKIKSMRMSVDQDNAKLFLLREEEADPDGGLQYTIRSSAC